MNSTIYCQQCGYQLNGLQSQTCPECGRAYDPKDPATHIPEERVGEYHKARRKLAGTMLAIGITAGLLLWSTHRSGFAQSVLRFSAYAITHFVASAITVVITLEGILILQCRNWLSLVRFTEILRWCGWVTVVAIPVIIVALAALDPEFTQGLGFGRTGSLLFVLLVGIAKGFLYGGLLFIVARVACDRILAKLKEG